jgi:D-cysteine desulfhydrase
MQNISLKEYFGLKKDLCFLPAPLVKLSKVNSVLCSPNILMKRYDLTGLGLGGNKTRKLEFVLQDALDRKYGALITAGAAQFNHCRQSAAAAQLQFECHLVLGGSAPNTANGNLLLNKFF